MKLIITIDTEADNQWARSDQIELKNIDYIPRFQELCEKYRFKPTYLITYEMATSEKFIRKIGSYQKDHKAEIGAHLHPWTTPPFIPLTDNDIKYHPFPCEYPEEVLREKLTVLTDTIEKNFEKRPMTFRAGRYGFDGKIASILSDLGYIADCSVTPLASWKKILGNPQGRGGPDFSGAPFQPYFLDITDYARKGDSQLLEVPISIFFIEWPLFNKYFHVLKKYVKDPQNITLRALYKLGYRPVWFRPLPDKEMKDLIQVYRVAKLLKIDYIEMIFHSSELMPGGSKNTKDKESVEKLYEIFTFLFRFLYNENVKSVTLAEYASTIIKNRN
jgi:hypothetical protein